MVNTLGNKKLLSQSLSDPQEVEIAAAASASFIHYFIIGVIFSVISGRGVLGFSGVLAWPPHCFVVYLFAN